MGKAGRRGKKRDVKKVSEPVAGTDEGSAVLAVPDGAGGDDGSGGDVVPGRLRAEDFAEKPDVSVVQVVQWVFDHLDLPDTKPDDSPSAGAWSQLLWAREDRNRFMSLWKSTCASPKRLAALGDDRDDGAELFSLLGKLAEVRTAAIGRATDAIVEVRGG